MTVKMLNEQGLENVIVVIGQVRLIGKSSRKLRKLSQKSKILFFTDSDGASLLSDIDLPCDVIDTSMHPSFLRIMGLATNSRCEAKLYQWARLEVAFEHLAHLISQRQISPNATILKLRTDVDLNFLNTKRLATLEPGEICCKTDWIYAFKASELNIMRGMIFEALEWYRTRSFSPISVANLPRVEFGAVRINWIPFEVFRDGLTLRLLNQQAMFAKAGRLGEWIHRAAVLPALSFSKSRYQNKPSAGLCSRPRHVRDDNCLASEMVFTAFVLENFKSVTRIFPIGFGALHQKRRQV